MNGERGCGVTQVGSSESSATKTFRQARDFLLNRRDSYDLAYRDFRWPEFTEFNWALDWFDAVAATEPTASRPALWIVEEDGTEVRYSFAEMSARSNQVANWLRSLGVGRGDRLILMLGNQTELWETILAAIKLGAVVIPASTLLGPNDLTDRVDRGNARHVVVRAVDAPKFAKVGGDYTRVAVGEAVDGWHNYADAYDASTEFAPDGCHARPPTRCCSTSPPARPRNPNSSSTRRFPTRSAICPQCTGSACGPATST